MEGVYDAKHVARVVPALRPRDHPGAGSTLGEDPGQPARNLRLESQRASSFLLHCAEGPFGSF